MYTGWSPVSYLLNCLLSCSSATQWQHYLLNCWLDRNNNRWNQNINASSATPRSQMVRRGTNNNRWNWETCPVAWKDRRSKLSAHCSNQVQITCKNNPICFHSSLYFLDLTMVDCKSCKYRCCAVHRCCAYPDVGENGIEKTSTSCLFYAFA